MLLISIEFTGMNRNAYNLNRQKWVWSFNAEIELNVFNRVKRLLLHGKYFLWIFRRGDGRGVQRWPPKNSQHFEASNMQLEQISSRIITKIQSCILFISSIFSIFHSLLFLPPFLGWPGEGGAYTLYAPPGTAFVLKTFYPLLFHPFPRCSIIWIFP